MLHPSPISSILSFLPCSGFRYFSYMNWYLCVVTLSVPYLSATSWKLGPGLAPWLKPALPALLLTGSMGVYTLPSLDGGVPAGWPPGGGGGVALLPSADSDLEGKR